MMMRKFGALLAGSAIAAVAVSSTAVAGGFQRGTADTDILFEQGTFSFRTGLTYVEPNRGFSSINGVDADYDDYTGNYKIPSAAIAFGNEAVSCAGTMTESFAAEADYEGGLPVQVSSRFDGADVGTSNNDRLDFTTAASTSSTLGTEFSSNEFGATCRVSYSMEQSRFSLLGGLFVEDLEFNGQSIGETLFSPLAGGLFVPSVVDVDSSSGYEVGYRIGAAYEMPEIALRAQVLYRSEVTHDGISGSGSVTITGDPTVGPTRLPLDVVGAPTAAFVRGALAAADRAPGDVVAVESFLSDSISPQSITINAQTGIAAGTLLIGSFRWTDWSTNDAVVSSITGPGIDSSSYAPYEWDDGYTASIGIGRAFNEEISGAVSLGYDSGVSTGADTTYTDLYTISGGIALKPDSWGEIRIGGLVGYWTDGEQSIEDGAYFDGEVDDTIVLAGSASLKLTF